MTSDSIESAQHKSQMITLCMSHTVAHVMILTSPANILGLHVILYYNYVQKPVNSHTILCH